MRIRDLPDLELAGLVGVLADMLQAALVLGVCPPIVRQGLNTALRETINRRAGGPFSPRLFDVGAGVPLEQLRDWRELMDAGVDGLEVRGFHEAARFLRERADAEITVYPPAGAPPRYPAGIELRHFN